MLKMFFLVANPVTSWFNNQIHRFLLWLDQSVYWFAAQCYQLFMKLSTAQIFTDDFFSSFAKRIYAILGVFMLFYLVYALLNAIVDPDKLTNDKGAGKIAVNLIISLTLLGLLPNIFDLAYRMQNFVLSSNLLGAVILGSDVVDVSDSESVKENNESLIRFGDYASFTVLNSFLNPENVNPTLDNGYNWYGVKEEILEEGKWKNLTLLSDAVSNGASIDGENVVVTYRPLVSTAAGIFLIYILLSFTLDLGVRVVKFAFYELLAPIPIVLRIIPSKKGTFDKWLKQTLSVYFEVFVRVGLMYIAIYFINAITTNNTLMEMWTKSTSGKLALAIIIIGVFAFAKQAPKIISDVLGIDTGGLKLGIGDKLKAGGFFGAGAMLGAGATGLVRNGIHGAGNVFNSGRLAVNSFHNGEFKNGFKNVGKAVLGVGAGIGSTIAGTTSAMYNAYGSGKKAGNFKDMAKAAGEGAQVSLNNREKRASYVAAHGGLPGTAASYLRGALNGVQEWTGLTPDLNSLKRSQNLISSVSDSRKAVMDRAKFIRDTIEDGKRRVSSKYTDIDGVDHSYSNLEIGYLRQHYEHLKSTGASAEDLRNMELLLKSAEKQANIDIINGLDKDGITPKTSADYDGDLKAQLNKLATSINAANNELTQNVKNETAKLDKTFDFLSDNPNADFANLATSGVKVYEELVDSINKPMNEAKNSVNQKINTYYEQKNDKK